MKLRAGFVSNSSTASFVVKTRPTEIDKIFMSPTEEADKISFLTPEKIELLKSHGFVPTRLEDPFIRELVFNVEEYDKVKLNTEDDTLLGFWISCNNSYVLQFLVANDIPFKAAVHYSHALYSYDPKDEYIYILRNFGIEYFHKPKELEEEMNNPEDHKWLDTAPFRKISKKEFLEDYDEKMAIELMKK